MTRLRQSLVRRPALLSWALLALTSQALAVTLDWCLHGDDAHVELVAAPHHGEVQADAHQDCHGTEPAVTEQAASTGCEGLMFSVVVDGAVKAAVAPDFDAAPAFVLYGAGGRTDRRLVMARVPCARSPAGATSSLRIPGVLAGTSTRLLI